MTAWAALLLLPALALAKNRGSIQVAGYGEVWVIAPDWANVVVDTSNGFTLHGNSRMYFASRPTDGFEADAYWQVKNQFFLCAVGHKKTILNCFLFFSVCRPS